MRATLPILAFALLLGVWVAPANAQRRGGPPDPEIRMERMAERLDLTEAQQDQVLAIMREQAEEREEILAQDRIPETREQMHELRKETRERIAQILTEQQKDQLRRAAPRGRRGGPGVQGRRGPRRGPARGDCPRG